MTSSALDRSIALQSEYRIQMVPEEFFYRHLQLKTPLSENTIRNNIDQVIASTANTLETLNHQLRNTQDRLNSLTTMYELQMEELQRQGKSPQELSLTYFKEKRPLEQDIQNITTNIEKEKQIQQYLQSQAEKVTAFVTEFNNMGRSAEFIKFANDPALYSTVVSYIAIDKGQFWIDRPILMKYLLTDLKDRYCQEEINIRLNLFQKKSYQDRFFQIRSQNLSQIKTLKEQIENDLRQERNRHWSWTPEYDHLNRKLQQLKPKIQTNLAIISKNLSDPQQIYFIENFSEENYQQSKQQLRRCLDNPSVRFIHLAVRLKWAPPESGAHANVLIVDKGRKRLYFLEPHVTNEWDETVLAHLLMIFFSDFFDYNIHTLRDISIRPFQIKERTIEPATTSAAVSTASSAATTTLDSPSSLVDSWQEIMPNTCPLQLQGSDTLCSVWSSMLTYLYLRYEGIYNFESLVRNIEQRRKANILEFLFYLYKLLAEKEGQKFINNVPVYRKLIQEGTHTPSLLGDHPYALSYSYKSFEPFI